MTYDRQNGLKLRIQNNEGHISDGTRIQMIRTQFMDQLKPETIGLRGNTRICQSSPNINPEGLQHIQICLRVDCRSQDVFVFQEFQYEKEDVFFDKEPELIGKKLLITDRKYEKMGSGNEKWRLVPLFEDVGNQKIFGT